MEWSLFFQIEVILLTIGLVAVFVLSVRQNAKDNSFFKRASAITKGITILLKDMIDNKRNAKEDIIREMVEAIKENKKGSTT